MARRTDPLYRMFYRAASGNRVSRSMGRLADARLPRRVLAGMIRSYRAAFGISLVDFEVPAAGFQTFDEFFTRRLRPGARRIDPDPAVLASPCDGKVQTAGTVRAGTVLQAKGREYLLADLLGDPSLCQSFEGGPFVTVYLSPKDYHRVHFPCPARVTAARHTPGVLYSVQPRAADVVDRLFVRNERLTTLFESPFGLVALVMVGATGVGRITVTYGDQATNVGRCCGYAGYEPPLPFGKGDELGTFHLGSTVVLVLPPGDWESLVPAAGKPVRLGQALFRHRAAP